MFSTYQVLSKAVLIIPIIKGTPRAATARTSVTACWKRAWLLEGF